MPRIRRAEGDRELLDSHGPEFLEILARGLRIISLFNAERRQLTLSELATLADAPRSSVRRVLVTLEKLGFVEQTGRSFKLTPRILTLASAYLTSNPLPAIMQPVVDRISRQIAESCSAAVLDRKIELLLHHFGTQRSKDWFDAETFRGLARLRGMETRAPERYAEAFVIRKLCLDPGPAPDPLHRR